MWHRVDYDDDGVRDPSAPDASFIFIMTPSGLVEYSPIAIPPSRRRTKNKFVALVSATYPSTSIMIASAAPAFVVMDLVVQCTQGEGMRLTESQALPTMEAFTTNQKEE